MTSPKMPPPKACRRRSHGLAVGLALALFAGAAARAAGPEPFCPMPELPAAHGALLAANPILAELGCRAPAALPAVLARLDALLTQARPVPPDQPRVESFALEGWDILGQNPALATVFLSQPEAALDLIRVIQKAAREGKPQPQ